MMPDSMIATMSSVVATGRRMKGSETFISSIHRCAWTGAFEAFCRPLLASAAALPPRAAAAFAFLSAASSGSGRWRDLLAVDAAHAHVQSIAQPVGAVSHNLVAGRKPAVHRRHAAALRIDIGRTDGDLAHRDGVVGIDQIDEGAHRAARRRTR